MPPQLRRPQARVTLQDRRHERGQVVQTEAPVRCRRHLPSDERAAVPAAGAGRRGGACAAGRARAYVKFDVNATAAGKGLTIKFWLEGGHPVVLMEKDGWPSLLDNHYVLSTTEELGTEATFSISPGDLKGAGSYVLGIFNMQYYRDSTCSWALDLVGYIPSAPPPTPPQPHSDIDPPSDDTDDSPADHRGLFWLLAMSAIAIAG